MFLHFVITIYSCWLNVLAFKPHSLGFRCPPIAQSSRVILNGQPVRETIV